MVEHANVTAFLTNIEANIINELSETAAKIALQNFEWQFMTMVYFNSSLTLAADLFLKSYRKAVVIGQSTFYPKFTGDTHQYVLFGSDVADIIHALEWMRDHEFDNDGKYVVVCQEQHPECDEVLAMKALWKFKITNVVFLNHIENEVVGFTYFPLSDSSCIYDQPVGLANLTSCLDAKESCHLYPMKLTNFNTCPLIVSTFSHKPYMKFEDGKPTGTDGDLICLIAEKLNASLTMMTPIIGSGWGKLEENGTWSGSLADVSYDLANISMTSAALTLTRFSSFQVSIPYSVEVVIWCTPTAEKIPSSLKLSYPFQQDARITLIASFAIVVICSLIFHSKFYIKLSRKLKLEMPRNLIFYSWTICMGLGIPTSGLPKKTALLYVVLLWTWYCILVRTFYQVSLMSAMKSNYYYENLESLEEAIGKSYSFGGGAGLKDYYIDDPIVYNNWQIIKTAELIPTLIKVSQGMEFVVVMSMFTTKTVIWEEKIKVNILSHKVVTSPTVLFFKKFSPIADAVNEVLRVMVEAGFTEKFVKDYVPTVGHKTEDAVESIKLEHYAGCYAVLGIGWLISYILFIAEVIFHRVNKK